MGVRVPPGSFFFSYSSSVVLEGKYTTEMQLKHTDSSLKVILEVKKQIDEASEMLSPEERERLNDYKRAPLLNGKVNPCYWQYVAIWGQYFHIMRHFLAVSSSSNG